MYYDGYRFSKDAAETLFNSDMVLYYLRSIRKNGQPPEELLDTNVASDYGKLESLFSIYIPEKPVKEGQVMITPDSVMEDRYKILVDLLTEKSIAAKMTSQFSMLKFSSDDFKSLLFYMGYATIESWSRGVTSLRIPNYVISTLFADCFYAIGHKGQIDQEEIAQLQNAFDLIEKKADVTLLVEMLEKDLKDLSNRFYERFDEKYIQLIAYHKATRYLPYIPVLERETYGGYGDLLLLERRPGDAFWNVLIEFKYIRMNEMKTEKSKAAAIEAKRAEALAQIARYIQDPQLAELDRQGRLRKYILVFSKNGCELREEVV